MRSIDFDKLAHDAARPDPRSRRDVPALRPEVATAATAVASTTPAPAPGPTPPAQLPGK